MLAGSETSDWSKDWIPTINELFIHTQPAHLQKVSGGFLESGDRNATRAAHIREKLGLERPRHRRGVMADTCGRSWSTNAAKAAAKLRVAASDLERQLARHRRSAILPITEAAPPDGADRRSEACLPLSRADPPDFCATEIAKTYEAS